MPESLERFVDDVFLNLDAEDAPTLSTIGETLYGEKPGDRIGRYMLVEVLGQGGFGAVWRAAQAYPVKREVALKIIKMGMDTREVIARFEAERQALAVMDHPNVAKVFDAGATPAGRPYFVMELVRGAPLNRYCDQKEVSLHARLRLFVGVCRAIQHAHQKGIIHRDLKPSNLLVTLLDDKAVPKVIDFGIAKATGGTQLTDQTLVTQFNRLMGTPAYMSPEQSEPGMDVDTRTDIYSLGVVLYELLTGELPFDLGPDGRPIRSRDPRRPSTRIRGFTAEQLRRLGERQRMGKPRLIGQVRGDLDWIVLKALEHDRARRYDSANDLADDLQAYLDQRPVSARPPSARYLLARFAQRNKFAVAAALALLLTLLAGITATTLMYLRARSALARSQEVSRILRDTLAHAGVSKSLGRDATMLREILDQTAQRIGTEIRGEPEVEAELRGIIGDTYNDLDEYDKALEQSSQALRLRRELHDGDHAELARALVSHANNLEMLGRVKESEPLIREGLAMMQRLFGDDDPRTGGAHALLSWVLMKANRPAEGEKSAELAMNLWRKQPANELLVQAPGTLSSVYFRTNRHDECIKIMEEELAELRRQYGREHPYIASALDNLGMELCRVKRFEEAEPYLLEGLRQGEMYYKGRNPFGDHTLAGLSKVAASRKQWDKQLDYARRGLDAAKAVYAPGHRYFQESASVLARVLIDHAERAANDAWSPDADRSAVAAAKVDALVQELRNCPDFKSSMKSAAPWVDCIAGYAAASQPSRRQEGRGALLGGLGKLRKLQKPSTEDQQRLKKGEAMLAELPQ